MQLKQFEESLGHKLFDRKSRKLVLNEYGKIVYEYSNRIFSLTQQMQRAVVNSKEKRLIDLHIGAVPTVAKKYLYDFLLPIISHKNSRITVYSHSLTQLLLDLESRKLDAIITDLPFVRNKHTKLESTKLTTRRIVAVAGQKFNIHTHKPFPKMLNGLSFINYLPSSSMRAEIDYYFQKHKIEPNTIGEVEDIDFLRIVTEEGHCFSICPYPAIKDYIKSNRLIILGELNTLDSGIWIVHRPDSDKIQIIKKLINQFHLLKQMKK